MKRLCTAILVCCLTAVLLFPAGSAQAEALVEDRGVELTEGIVIRYPAVAGMEDEPLQEQVNAQIQEDCRIREYLARATLLISGGNLRTEWTGGILGDVFSCAVSAEGALETTRTAHRWTGSNVDLRDGHEIAFAELFTDEAAARETLEAYLEDEVAPELSALLLNSELLPLPDTFRLDRTGLTLLYPAEQLSTLSDRAGDIRISWHELREVLDTAEDSIPSRIGATDTVTLSEESGKRLLAAAAEGRMEGVPAAIGDSMQELTDRYHLLTDPDGYQDGRLFALEGSCFRGVYLLTDDLGRSWENSRVQGIRLDQGGAECLFIGHTAREDWLAVLGEPEHTAAIDGEKAEANRLVPGRCDYYECGAYQLRFYSDEDGILVSVVLTE